MADRISGGELARREVDEHLPVQLQSVGDGVHGEVAADVAAEVGLVAERQPADRGVQSVGADPEVEPAGRTAFEG